MKNILVISLLIFNYSILKAQDDIKIDSHNLKWNLDYDIAKKNSLNEDKPMLMFFTGSDWCGPCILLEKNYLRILF